MNYILLENVSKSFNNREIIVNLSLSIKRNTFVSIVGQYGTGKSTVLNMIAGLLEPESGSISIDGKKPEMILKQHLIGYAFQQSNLLPWRNVLRNITLPGEVAGQDNTDYAQELMDLLKITDLDKKYPNELSGGMKQMVSIIRSMIMKPDVVLLDEPFASIDEINKDELHDKLLGLYKIKKQTVVMVTHSLQEAIYLSHKVVVLGGKPATIVHAVETSHIADKYDPLIMEVARNIKDKMKECER